MKQISIENYPRLKAGPLTVLFENGGLRYIKLGKKEVLRQVYVAVRDHEWGTVEAEISDLIIKSGKEEFQISFTARHKQASEPGGINFLWHANIVGDLSGKINFSLDGEALSDFLTNRIGFCILHPINGCAGQPCEIEHSNRQIESGQFPAPDDISPHQPYLDIRAITHEVLPGLRATVRMEGEIFEMEDHRNWTDNSFKTYGTPLSLPFPVAVKKGDRFRQSVTLTLSGQPPEDPDTTGEVELSLSEVPAGKLPLIGFGLAETSSALNHRELEWLRALRPSHLRVDIDLARNDFADKLARASKLAESLDAGLEAALLFSGDISSQLAGLQSALELHRPKVAAWLILDLNEKVTSAETLNAVIPFLRRFSDEIPCGAGTDSWFAELNRNRSSFPGADLVCYPISPQVHAADELTLMENLEAQAATVFQARRLFERPVAVSPVTLRPRFGVAVNRIDQASPTDELPDNVDERQPSLMTAAWTVGSIKYLAESGAARITYYESSGFRGVLMGESENTLPEKFPATPGTVYPVYHVLADIAEFSGGEILPINSSDPLSVIGLMLRSDHRRRLMVANLTRSQQTARILIGSQPTGIRRLTESDLPESQSEPEFFRRQSQDYSADGANVLTLTLSPHETATLDFAEQSD